MYIYLVYGIRDEFRTASKRKQYRDSYTDNLIILFTWFAKLVKTKNETSSTLT